MNWQFEDRGQEREKDEREAFDRIISRQRKFVKKAFLLSFGIIGIVFAIFGAILFFTASSDEESFITAIVFLSLGVLYVLLGIILFFAIPEKYNYERYKKRMSRCGGVTLYDLAVSLRLAEEKISVLEERISALEESKDK